MLQNSRDQIAQETQYTSFLVQEAVSQIKLAEVTQLKIYFGQSIQLLHAQPGFKSGIQTSQKPHVFQAPHVSYNPFYMMIFSLLLKQYQQFKSGFYTLHSCLLHKCK